MSTIDSYRRIVANLDRSLARLSARPEIAREVSYFLSHVRDATSAAEFVADDRLFGFAMKAFGLGDLAYGKAFMRKVLEGGIDGPKSFALQLADGRFREFAETFNFARYGATATAFDRAQQGVVDRFLRSELETQAGTSDEGVRLALYFRRKAPEVDSVYGLLSDAALYKVVRTALGLPAAFSSVDIDRQAATIAASVDVASLQDPVRLEKLIARFAARWQSSSESGGVQVPQIGLSQNALTAMPMSTLLSLQSLRPGGRR